MTGTFVMHYLVLLVVVELLFVCVALDAHSTPPVSFSPHLAPSIVAASLRFPFTPSHTFPPDKGHVCHADEKHHFVARFFYKRHYFVKIPT